MNQKEKEIKRKENVKYARGERKRRKKKRKAGRKK